MSISVFGVGATPLLKTIPALFEKSDLLEFTLGPVPIIQFIAWDAITLKIDFIGAAPNFFVTWRVVCRSILSLRLNGTCVTLQSHVSLAFQCHTRVLSSRNWIALDLSMYTPDISAPRVLIGVSRDPRPQ
jgi:hypothetical protein